MTVIATLISLSFLLLILDLKYLVESYVLKRKIIGKGSEQRKSHVRIIGSICVFSQLFIFVWLVSVFGISGNEFIDWMITAIPLIVSVIFQLLIYLNVGLFRT